MKIILAGSGVVGLTSAWHLARTGHAITVLEAAQSPAEGASGANGAQLSWRYTDPMGSPGIFPDLANILAGRDEAISMHLQPRLSFYRWGARFLWECFEAREDANAKAAFDLAQESEKEFTAFMAAEKLEFDYRVSGKIIIYRDVAAFEKAAHKMQRKIGWGADVKALNAAQCIALDPALASVSDLAGGIYAPMDACGDCAKFTKALAQLLQQKYGVTFEFNTRITGFKTEGSTITALQTNRGERQADAHILATGNGSYELGAKLGLDVPVEPVKGYSLTLPVRSGAPKLSVTDAARRIVVCRLGDQFRISGFAELAGYDRTVYPEKIDRLRAAAKQLFPHAADYDAPGTTWAGFRPTTPSGRPLIGPTRFANLFLNTGHGMYGWTQSHASAALLARYIL